MFVAGFNGHQRLVSQLDDISSHLGTERMKEGILGIVTTNNWLAALHEGRGSSEIYLGHVIIVIVQIGPFLTL